jgi:hypothetical protein
MVPANKWRWRVESLLMVKKNGNFDQARGRIRLSLETQKKPSTENLTSAETESPS